MVALLFPIFIIGGTIGLGFLAVKTSEYYENKKDIKRREHLKFLDSLKELKKYKLKITTNDGDIYYHTTEPLPARFTYVNIDEIINPERYQRYWVQVSIQANSKPVLAIADHSIKCVEIIDLHNYKIYD